MEPVITWLHLTDLHINFLNETNEEAHDDFLELFKTPAENPNKITHIFVTGDCTYRNGSFALAERFLNQICSELAIPKSRVYLVPGNHDIYQDNKKRIDLLDTLYNQVISDLEEDPTNIISKEIYTDSGKLQNKKTDILLSAFKNTESDRDFLNFYRSFFENEYSSNMILFYKDKTYPLNVVHLNTCLFSYGKDNDADHRDRMILDTREIKNQLRACRDALSGNCLNIMIGHHSYDTL